jgi:hypothetical protein
LRLHLFAVFQTDLSQIVFLCVDLHQDACFDELSKPLLSDSDPRLADDELVPDWEVTSSVHAGLHERRSLAVDCLLACWLLTLDWRLHDARYLERHDVAAYQLLQAGSPGVLRR